MIGLPPGFFSLMSPLLENYAEKVNISKYKKFLSQVYQTRKDVENAENTQEDSKKISGNKIKHFFVKYFMQGKNWPLIMLILCKSYVNFVGYRLFVIRGHSNNT